MGLNPACVVILQLSLCGFVRLVFFFFFLGPWSLISVFLAGVFFSPVSLLLLTALTSALLGVLCSCFWILQVVFYSCYVFSSSVVFIFFWCVFFFLMCRCDGGGRVMRGVYVKIVFTCCLVVLFIDFHLCWLFILLWVVVLKFLYFLVMF